MNHVIESTSTTHWGLKALAILTIVTMGLPLLFGGAYLISLGGSWYYALAGLVYTYAAVQLFRGRMRGIWVLVAAFIVTVLWALYESKGFKFWSFEARVIAPMFLAGLGLLLARRVSAAEGRPASTGLHGLIGAGLLACFVGMLVAMFFPHGIISDPQPITKGKARPATLAADGQWLSYSRTGEATRFAPFDQIGLNNVTQLEQAWVVHSGDIAEGGASGKEEQNTPLYADGIVYHCSPMNIVTAIDGASGKVLWRFDPKSKFAFWKRCRTLGYYNPALPAMLGGGSPPAATPATTPPDAAAVASQASADGKPQPDAGDNDTAAAAAPAPAAASDGSCAARIFVANIDAKLYALDAKTGKTCPGFGSNGMTDLNAGMGEVPPGFYVPTTGAIVAGTRILIGGWIGDNYSVGEPSGVVRAFDVITGELAWAWDLGNPGNSGFPEAGKTYTRGTPNVWAPMAFDLELGMVYLPLGNATPDYYGGKRRPFDDEYNSSIVALDLATGKERWHYNTVHHDIWDYDVPSQPTLADFPDGKGGFNPAVIQSTKRGQVFVLDRRTGVPLVEVVEKPVPQGDGTATGEYYSKTQPYSVGIAALGAEPLTESRMWGMTPIDQMVCRIMFKQHYYEGDFTPQSTRKTIGYPGNNGGPNWGGNAIDEERNIMVVADMRVPVSQYLIPRKDIPPQDQFKPDPHGEMSPQFGLPFGQFITNFFSPLGVPCLEPPIGTISAIDLGTRKLLWQRPAGTMKDISLGGFKPSVPFYVGMPALGGAFTTRSGLTFYSATQDYYLRAFNTETGDEVWKARLPSGSQSTPMTYVDKASGRQFIVVTAGGARYNPSDRGDWIIAYALPDERGGAPKQ